MLVFHVVLDSQLFLKDQFIVYLFLCTLKILKTDTFFEQTLATKIIFAFPEDSSNIICHRENLFLFCLN